MGLAPDNVEVGDYICFVLGHDIFMVLRSSGERGTLLYVGECYIHGLMAG